MSDSVIRRRVAVVATARPSRRRPPARGIVHAVAVYGLLVVLGLFVLLPVGWMLTAALKPDTVPVFTYPPEWFPTRYFDLSSFEKALFDPDEPFLRYALNTAMLVFINIVGTVVSCSLIAYAFARLRDDPVKIERVVDPEKALRYDVDAVVHDRPAVSPNARLDTFARCVWRREGEQARPVKQLGEHRTVVLLQHPDGRRISLAFGPDLDLAKALEPLLHQLRPPRRQAGRDGWLPMGDVGDLEVTEPPLCGGAATNESVPDHQDRPGAQREHDRDEQGRADHHQQEIDRSRHRGLVRNAAIRPA